ncbi:MAG: GAF domain-containing protein [Mycobacteriaceae bacterium]
MARTVALTAASSLLGGSDIRAICYETAGSAPHRTLSPIHSLGRSDEATRVFDESTELGADVFVYLDAHRVRFCPSIDDDPSPGYETPDAPMWKSFVSAPIVAKGAVVGMLTVDSRCERDFNEEEDPYLLKTIANLLAVTWKA